MGKVQRVKEHTNYVYIMRCVGGQRRNGSQWWSEVGVAAAERRIAIEEWLQKEMGIHMTGTRH